MDQYSGHALVAPLTIRDAKALQHGRGRVPSGSKPNFVLHRADGVAQVEVEMTREVANLVAQFREFRCRAMRCSTASWRSCAGHEAQIGPKPRIVANR